MGAATLLALIVKIAPTLISLVEKAVSFLHDRQMIDAGKAQALEESTAKLTATVGKAKAAAAEAAARAAADQTDAAFDSDFQRSE